MYVAIDRPPKSANPFLGYLVDSSSVVVFPVYLILGTGGFEESRESMPSVHKNILFKRLFRPV